MQSNHHDRIKEATVEDMPGDELGNKFPLIPPPSNPSLRLGVKWPREAEPKTLTQLWRRVQESTVGGRPSAPRAREGARGPTVLPRLVNRLSLGTE